MFNYNRNLKKQYFFFSFVDRLQCKIYLLCKHDNIWYYIYMPLFNFNLTQVNILIIFIINF